MGHKETDLMFDTLLPAALREKSLRHFTPAEVVEKAAGFLCCLKKNKILDLGSGIGKFCLLAGKMNPSDQFYGVEIRQNLCDEAERIRQLWKLKNVHFLHENILQTSFKGYTGFYYFNSFHENIEPESSLDYHLELNMKNYSLYSGRVYRELEKLSPGVRIVTFHVPDGSLPPEYQVLEHYFDATLLCYEKLI